MKQPIDDISEILQGFERSQVDIKQRIFNTLGQLIERGEHIPFPAEGQTYLRWKILSQVAATNLNLAKIYESHLDALAILHELNIEIPKHNQGLYAVWAAEGSAKPLERHPDQTLSGIKMWCSAAEHVRYGLITFRESQQSKLALIDMQHPQIQIKDGQWHALGMQYTQTAELHLNHVPVMSVASPNAYLTRVGFWHGAAGVAACWYGATVKLAHYLRQALQHKTDAFKEMYLGQMTYQLITTKTLFQDVATLIDDFPNESHELKIRILRAQVEATAIEVLNVVGKALGAAPFCLNQDFAQTHADLTVFIRQSHAAFDLQHIAEMSLNVDEETLWKL